MSATVATHVAGFLDDLSAHLRQLKESGVSEVEVDVGLVKNLARISAAPADLAPDPSVGTESSREEVTPMPSTLENVARRIAACTRCELCKTRKNTVPGQGSGTPEIMFIGEGPGADEDEQGLAFVGRAGQLLTRMIEAMGYQRDQVWIGNIVKCRPPNNRNPTAEEMNACLPYLREQIALLKPRVIVCLGAVAVKGLFDTTETISRLRGNWMQFEGIDTMPTFHPAYLLRNPPAKRVVWDDLKAVLKKLDKPLPAAG
jgi:uracil-DNA glycosylase